MSKIQFGWIMPAGPKDKEHRKNYLADIDKAMTMATGHFESVWFVDHLQFAANDLLEGWTALSYFAALYPQFTFGNGVVCQSFRNPALLAKMAATLQYLCNGRFILGVGAGWKEDEYKSYNFDFPAASTRVEELDEMLQITKKLWSEERPSFEGKHYKIEQAWCEPKPEPPPPIMVGAFKPKMLRVAARHADWWNVSWTSIEEYRHMVAECEKACLEIGRDVQTLRRTWFGHCVCGPTEAKIKDLNSQNLQAGNFFVGTPAQIIAQMKPFVELGVNYFMFSSQGFPDLTTMEMLIKEVIPAFKD